MKDFFKELLEGGLKKILVILIIPVLPFIAIAGNFHATGNYWWDLLIAFGITGVFVLLIWLQFRQKR